MDENLQIDANTRNVLGAITNDANEFIKNLRVNPSTGRLLVDAHVTSTNTGIGDTIPGGTAGSVLFLGAGSTLEEDNANFFYDSTNHFLGLGTDTPDSTLQVEGTFHYVDGNQALGFVLTSDASGNATWQSPTTGGLGDPGNSGIVVRTALDTTVARSISGTSNRINVTNGSGVSGSPTVDIASTYIGQNSITTLGTITTGVWNGTTIAVANGGTGQTTSAGALNSLLPSQSGQSGKFLTTDGTNPSWSSSGIGSGTVTSVSVVTANGVSGTVATATTTPAITLVLGAITPSSVAATGTVTGSNLSGTNTGNQTITLTGDVTGSGTGSFTATIGNNKVTYAKMQQASTVTLLGNPTGGTANVEEITLGAGLSFSGTTLVSTGGNHGSQQFNTPGTYTWVCPPGITSVDVAIVSGGGSGAQGLISSNNGGGGGGGGGGFSGTSTVVPFTAYTVVVGSGGVFSGSTPHNGTGSSFNGIAPAFGLAGVNGNISGLGGAAGDATAGAGGNGGIAMTAGSAGGTGTGGGTGGTGGASGSGDTNGGGGGAGGLGLTGGNGGSSGGNGAYGCGGGGNGGGGGIGAGGNGLVFLSW